MDGKSVTALVLLCAACALARPGGAQAQHAARDGALCALAGCACSPAKHPSWINVNCSFDSDQDVELVAGSLPHRAREVVLAGAGSVVLGARSFSNLSNLVLLSVHRVARVLVARHALLNLSTIHLQLEVVSCGQLTVETAAFKNAKGPATANIFNCGNVVLHEKSFFWLLTINITDVPSLWLSQGAFVFEPKSSGRHGVVTKIIFKNVTAPSLPDSAFGSSVDEIRLQNTNIGTVHPNAFNSISYNAVVAINSSFDIIHEEAFTQKSLILKLELFNCTIRQFDGRALLSGINDLVIKHCSVGLVDKGAVEITVVNVIMTDNEFEDVRTRGFKFKSWNVVRMERNFFGSLEPDAVACPVSDPGSSYGDYKFAFVDNRMMTVASGSLRFISDVLSVLPTIVYENNHFHRECFCDIESWLRDVFDKKSTPLQLILNNSYCSIKDPLVAQCLNVVAVGNALMKNYSSAVCDSEAVKCKPSSSRNKSAATEVQNTKFQNRRNQLKSDEEAKMWNRRILISILSVAALGTVIILLVMLVACARRRGYCTDVKNALISSNNCCVTFFDKFFNINYGLDTARSISRLSVNEYTESHRLNDTRMINIENGAVDMDNFTDEPAPAVDKATQTLPEELTKELLESLREKLDDPENYSEAREMIEHLYDLIKVEECCNSNGPPGPRADEDDNLYDVIQVPVRRQGRNDKVMVSVGTRAPSPDKLTAFCPYGRQTALCHDYFEPRDRAPHLYAELPGERNMPDLVGGRDRGSARPLSFLRAIGERIAAPAAATDTGGSARSARLANRPLPEKPRDPAAPGTSA